MTEEEEQEQQEDKNKRIRPRERARDQKPFETEMASSLPLNTEEQPLLPKEVWNHIHMEFRRL